MLSAYLYLLMLQWYILVLKVTRGGLKGYSGLKCMSKINTPPSYTDPGGPRIVLFHSNRLSPCESSVLLPYLFILSRDITGWSLYLVILSIKSFDRLSYREVVGVKLNSHTQHHPDVSRNALPDYC